jgi:predicted DNA-binding antitoxin AbrB/MazE fold protein
MPKIIEAIYEDGVFKPLERVNLKHGSRVKIVIQTKKNVLEKYRGVLGKANIEELKKFEEEVMF